MKNTLETSGEDVKTTLETSGEDVKTTLETSGEVSFSSDNALLFVNKPEDKYGESTLEIFSSPSGKDKALKMIQQVMQNTTVSLHSFAILQYDCKFP